MPEACRREQLLGCPGGSVFKNLFTNSRESRKMGSIPGLGKSPGEGNGSPLLYFCLGNPMDRGALQATVHGVAKTQMRLSMHARDTTKQQQLLQVHKIFLKCPKLLVDLYLKFMQPIYYINHYRNILFADDLPPIIRNHNKASIRYFS